MNLKKGILSIAVGLLLIAVAFLFIKPSPSPTTKLPNPNGYDDLVKAGQMFVGDLPDCVWDKLDDECLEKTRTFLKANSEALKLARLGLSRDSRVPVQYSQAYISKLLPELSAFRRLAQTLVVEGKVAEKENRIDDAIQSYLHTAQLNEKLRGSLMIESLVGLAVEPMGLGPLQKLATRMTRNQRRVVIKNLIELYSERDSLDEIMVRERNYVRRAYGIRDQFVVLAQSIFTMRATQRKYEHTLKYKRTRLGLFLVELAAQNFQLEKKRSPKTLQELVPEYLPFLPKDDFSGKDFIYHPLTNGYLLYGVGPDGKDDGGRPLSNRTGKATGDMLTSSPF